jgi:hypothetical protein
LLGHDLPAADYRCGNLPAAWSVHLCTLPGLQSGLANTLARNPASAVFSLRRILDHVAAPA